MNQITEIYADQIIDPVDPMRLELDRDLIDELAESIKSEGLIQPITVRPVWWHEPICEKRGHPAKGCLKCTPYMEFEVVAGHRRFKACAIAGIVQIPCIVKELTDDQTIEIRAHENLFRQDLDPIEEAVAIGKLVGDDGTKIPGVAKRMSKSVAWVEDRLNILNYPEYFLLPIKAGKLSLGVAKHLVKIKDDVYRKMFFDSAVANGMAIWQAEYYLRQWEAGIFKNSSEILSPDPATDKPEPAKMIAKCAKCGEMAEAPNLQNVFIHTTCPIV